jgi:hypothetical protein
MEDSEGQVRLGREPAVAAMLLALYAIQAYKGIKTLF